MTEYLTTKEVARHLRLNEKKVYQLVAEGRIPRARISGKWLFPRHLVDQWVAENTSYPSVGLFGALLDEMVVIQGSDDWLLQKATEAYWRQEKVPVVSAKIGSLGGLSAIAAGRTHVAGCHVHNTQVHEQIGSDGCYLVNLFERHQGLLFDGRRHPEVSGVADLVGSSLKFATRQPLSGTHRLSERLFAEVGASLDGLKQIGPFSSHLELGLAIKNGQADVGIGIQVTAQLCGLDFVRIHTEPYKLAVPLRLVSHPRLATFLDFVVDHVDREAARQTCGYDFTRVGRIETISSGTGKKVP